MYIEYDYRNQHGGTTLAMTVILLFVMTLVTLYAAKTSIKEQQISANQYRADQSLSTANAALDWGVAHLSQARGKFCDRELEATSGAGYTCQPKIMCTIATDDQTKCTLAYSEGNRLFIDHSLDDNNVGDDDALSIGATEMYYAFVKTDGTELEYIPVKGGIGERFINDGDGDTRVHYANIKIYGIGHSDDETGRRVVSVDVNNSNVFADPGKGGSSLPLVSKTTGAANASISVINRFHNRTIWSGNEVVISGSTNTHVLEEGLGWNCNDIRNHEKCVTSDTLGGEPLYTMRASEAQNDVNADIIDEDSNLANLGPDAFFKNFFGKTKKEMKTFAKETGLYVEANDSGGLTDPDGNAITWVDLADYTPLVWIEMPSGVDYAPSGNELGQIGLQEDPMVLIVDGNLNIGGTGGVGRILLGVLYVTGTWDASANLVVQGMVIVETDSELSGGGTPTLIYDADLFNGKMAPPPGTVSGAAPGTWKDWE